MSDTDPLDLDAAEARANRAGDEIDSLCENRMNWKWSIPANPDRDSDLILAASVADVPALIAEVRRLREETENHECRQTVARHGTRSKYIRGCRCDLCKESEAEYSRRRREQYAKLTIAADDPRHGTISCYNHYGCRCEACVAATSEYTRARRASMKGGS